MVAQRVSTPKGDFPPWWVLTVGSDCPAPIPLGITDAVAEAVTDRVGVVVVDQHRRLRADVKAVVGDDSG
ncbi:hypothetical protein Sros01_03840 [Streptomyces roseochromogenus]|nr:hypothetical protein Sros01_03840 [Streptomyces roseochromogenus]